MKSKLAVRHATLALMLVAVGLLATDLVRDLYGQGASWVPSTLMGAAVAWVMFGPPAAARFEARDPRYAEDKASLCPDCRAAVERAERAAGGLFPTTWPTLCPRDTARLDAWCVLDPDLPRPTTTED